MTKTKAKARKARECGRRNPGTNQAEISVPSPYGRGFDKAVTNLRDDPLARLRYEGKPSARNSDAQYHAAWATATGSGNIAIDYARIRVDGGGRPDALNQHQVDAVRHLVWVREEIGNINYDAFFEPVITQGQGIAETAKSLYGPEPGSQHRWHVREVIAAGLNTLKKWRI